MIFNTDENQKLGVKLRLSSKKLLIIEYNPDVRKHLMVCLPLNDITQQVMLNGTSDDSNMVRKFVFTVLRKKANVDKLMVKQRLEVLFRGLLEQNLAPRKVARKMVTKWFHR